MVRTRSCAILLGAGRALLGAGRAPLGAPPALLESPFPDPGMVAREQDLRDAPAPVLGGAAVVGIFRRACQRDAEGLLDRGVSVPKNTRELAQHSVTYDHRGKLTARQHIASDQHLVGSEVIDHTLIEALVAAA